MVKQVPVASFVTVPSLWIVQNWFGSSISQSTTGMFDAPVRSAPVEVGQPYFVISMGLDLPTPYTTISSVRFSMVLFDEPQIAPPRYVPSAMGGRPTQRSWPSSDAGVRERPMMSQHNARTTANDL